MNANRFSNALGSGGMAALLCLTPLAASQARAPAADAAALRFEISEGRNLNSFFRQGPVAAHLLLRSGQDPRILAAFPAGNSGVGLWFDHLGAEAKWALKGPISPLTLADAKGRPLYGITAEAEITAASLTPKQTLLSSVRVLRDYESLGIAPKPVRVDPVVEGNQITWARDRLDGAAGYLLQVTLTHGSIQAGRLIAGDDGKIGLVIVAASGETPLTPLGGEALLDARANPDAAARDTLNFLSYREKFLAGSWRFNTYFGRDTRMSGTRWMPVLPPAAVEGGLTSVLARLSPEGEVAHEEGIGEFALLAHRALGGATSDAPLYDYGMIDGNYMLPPVAAAWLLDDPRGKARAAAFLAAPSGRVGDATETAGAALVRNLRLVIARTTPFADAPAASRLLEIKPGRSNGQWRDSLDGLGRGRYPYDVNAVFAPAALAAIDRLTAAGLLDPYMTAEDRQAFAGAARAAAVWRDKAAGYFDVAVPADQARKAVAAYARAQGVPEAPALAAIGAGPLRFHALSLNADGSPVSVVNSDEGFDLLFGQPDPKAVDGEVAALMRPFPAGLMTDVGLLVADPAFAPAATQALFTRNAYHGLVIWSWQQAVLAAGLQRQLARQDLPAPVRARLVAADGQLWRVIEAQKAMQSSELWSWAFADGRYKVVAFGAGAGDADESNAAQLWSSVFLALRPPAR